MRILLRISTAWKVWDFDFLRGLAPGRLDGFSIERYERNRVPFRLSVAGFDFCCGAILWMKIAPALEPFQKAVSSLLLSFYAQ